MTRNDGRRGVRAFVRDNGTWVARFDSVGELVEFALEGGSFAHHGNQGFYGDWTARHEGRAYWNGYTIERMRAELRSPARERLEAVCELGREVALPPPKRPVRRVCVRRPDGDELDPLAWVRRDPDGWIAIERTTTRAPRPVRIGVNLSVPWYAKPHELLYRGAAAVALADHYTRQGCSVSITAFDCGQRLTRWMGTHVLEVALKRPSEPLDLPMLALALAELARACLRVVRRRRVAGSTAAAGSGPPMAPIRWFRPR